MKNQYYIVLIAGATLICSSFGLASTDYEYAEIACPTLNFPTVPNPVSGECTFEVVENMAYGATVLETIQKTTRSAQTQIEKECEMHGMLLDRYAYSDVSGGIADLKLTFKDLGSGLIVSKVSGKFVCKEDPL